MALQALEVGETDDPEQHAQLLLRLGRARHRAGDARGGSAACVEAARLAEDALTRGQAAVEYHGVGLVGGWLALDVAQVALYEDAAEALRAEAPAPERDALLARVLSYHSMVIMFREPEHAAALAREAVEVAAHSGRAEAVALGAIAASYTGGPSDIAAFRALIEQVDSDERQDALLSSLSNQLWVSGDRDQFDQNAERLAELASRARSPGRIAAAVQRRGFQAALDGRFAEAEELFFSTLEAARKIGDATLLAAVGLGVFPCYREVGRLGELARATRRLADAPDAIVGWRVAYPHLLAESGEELDEAAVRAAECVAALREGFPFDTTGSYIFAALADVAWRCGASDIAEAALGWGAQPEMPALCSVASVSFHGAADRARGLAQEVLDRPELAVPLHQAAIALHEKLRAPVWVARSKFDLARALVARCDRGDIDRAIALLNEAMAAATSFGATRLLDEALTLKLDIQGIGAGSSPALSIDAVSASVTVDRPDLRKYAAADGHVTFCFSDIVGYSTLNDRLGDTRTHALLGVHNALLREALTAHGGTEVKSHGDGFMLVFADTGDALHFAIDFQRALNVYAWPADIEGLEVRMGVHRGEAIRDHDDFYGRTVILGARISTQAAGREILVSDDVRRVGAGFEFGATRAVALKGLSGRHNVHTLPW
jgi:class 3 adenylate cyclase